MSDPQRKTSTDPIADIASAIEHSDNAVIKNAYAAFKATIGDVMMDNKKPSSLYPAMENVREAVAAAGTQMDGNEVAKGKVDGISIAQIAKLNEDRLTTYIWNRVRKQITSDTLEGRIADGVREVENDTKGKPAFEAAKQDALAIMDAMVERDKFILAHPQVDWTKDVNSQISDEERKPYALTFLKSANARIHLNGEDLPKITEVMPLLGDRYAPVEQQQIYQGVLADIAHDPKVKAAYQELLKLRKEMKEKGIHDPQEQSTEALPSLPPQTPLDKLKVVKNQSIIP